jgi:S1-C subfamily serine protease
MEVNAKPVKSLVEFCKLVASNPDQSVNLTVLDNGTRRTLRTEKLTPVPELNRQLLQKRLGLSAQALTEQQAAGLRAAGFNIKVGEGLRVSEVEKESPAQRAQLQAGMVLTGIDASGIHDQVNVSNILGNKQSGEVVQLTLLVPQRLSAGYLAWQAVKVNMPAR